MRNCSYLLRVTYALFAYLLTCVSSQAVAGNDCNTSLESIRPASPYALVISEPNSVSLQDKLSYQLSAPYARVVKQLKPVDVEKPINPELADKPFAKEIESASREAELDVALVHAVIYVESRHRQNALSPKGAIGLMQVLPATAVRYGVDNPAKSAYANLKAGTSYLRYLMSLFDQQLDLVLAAYNAGEGAVIRRANTIPPYRETQNYVKAVRAKYEEFSGKKHDENPPAPEATQFIEYMAGTRLVSSLSNTSIQYE